MAIYQERESKTLEFKPTITKFNSVIKTSVAFANGVGGKIIIGIDDQTRRVLGIDNKIRDRIYDDFPSSLYDSTSPNLMAQIYEQRIDEQVILIIEIPASIKKPCFVRSKGLPKGVYIRVGSSTRRANEESIASLMRDNQHKTYDEESAGVDMSALPKDNLSQYYKKITKNALLEDKIITRSAANPEQYFTTIAGLLLFSNKPDLHIPEAHIICTRFSGVNGRDIIQTEVITGHIEKQADVGLNLVMSWLRRNYRLDGAKMKSNSLLPEAAVREAIINAIIHRKYTIAGAVKIALYEDRLEIFSPGNFPGHVNVDHLGDGITHLRNPVIGRMAHKMGIIEKLGSGMRLIFDKCRSASLAAPIFCEDGDYVKVTFKFKPLVKPTQTDEEILLLLLEHQETVTMREMVSHLGRAQNTVLKLVKNLMGQNRIKRIGNGPATKYTLM